MDDALAEVCLDNAAAVGFLNERGGLVFLSKVTHFFRTNAGSVLANVTPPTLSLLLKGAFSSGNCENSFPLSWLLALATSVAPAAVVDDGLLAVTTGAADAVEAKA